MPEIITPMEILPHPFDPEQRIIPLTVIRAEKRGTEDEPIIRFIATDGSEDRHGSRINPNGWDLTHYRKNPVILWGHNQSIPAIGKGEEITLANGRMELDVRFALDAWDVPGMGNLAMLLFRLASQDFVRAMSTSFIPKAWREIEAQTIPSFFAENVEYERQEMTENSIVNVPSNRLALKKAVAEHVISENEAGLLGLGAMLRFESPIMVRTESGVIAPKDSVADEPKRDATEFAARVSEVLTRCGYVEVFPQPIEIPEEQKDEVRATLNELASQALERLDTCLVQWKNAESPEELRRICSIEISNSMWLFDRCANLLHDWFSEPIGAVVPEIDFDEAERAVSAARVGKVFSAKNLAKIDQIITLATDLRAAADAVNEEAEDEERENAEIASRVSVLWNGAPPPADAIIKITSGSESREQDSNATIRVLASDAAPDRSAESPAPADLYRVMLAD